MKKLTFTLENYLEAIFELSPEGSGVRMSDVAARLGVTKASVNTAMAALAERGLIVNEKYREVFLTPAGLDLARFTAEKHHVILRFFQTVLSVDPTVANGDACAIEHVISDDSIEAMRRYLETAPIRRL